MNLNSRWKKVTPGWRRADEVAEGDAKENSDWKSMVEASNKPDAEGGNGIELKPWRVGDGVRIDRYTAGVMAAMQSKLQYRAFEFCLISQTRRAGDPIEVSRQQFKYVSF